MYTTNSRAEPHKETRVCAEMPRRRAVKWTQDTAEQERKRKGRRKGGSTLSTLEAAGEGRDSHRKRGRERDGGDASSADTDREMERWL